ncbi:hypothetical protein ACIOEW_23135 [Streptomyces sp. NPDC087901]|uniref:hypothetical protein n=1 Tax=Streptomyces sp. NPDC087901 TaxID=3365818 RepID=UPI0038145C76
MRVEVIQVLAPSHEFVRFECDSGTASGRWMGLGPAELGQFDVEIEVPEEVAEWTAVPSGDTSISGGVGRGHAANMVCRVLGFDEGDDSVVGVRVGLDIILIEILNRRSEIPLGGLISFRTPEIQIYPYDL